MTVKNKDKLKQKNEKYRSINFLRGKRIITRAVVLAFIIFILSGVGLFSSWKKHANESSSQAILLASSIKADISQWQIGELSGSAQDLIKPEYRLIKENLEELVNEHNLIYTAYLYTERNGEIVILLDSKLPDSPGYFSPGEVYKQADEIFYEPFKTGKIAFTKLKNDRLGSSLIIIPINDTTSGEIIAALGMEYSAMGWYNQFWKHIINVLVIIIFVFLLFFAFIYGWIQYDKNEILGEKLSASETFYRSVFNEAPIGIAIIADDGSIAKSYANSSNREFEKILGRSREDLDKIKWSDITHPEDLQENIDKFTKFKKGEISGYSIELRYLKPDGSYVWVNMIISAFVGQKGKLANHICIIQDITKAKELEMQLIEGDRKHTVLLSNLPGLAYRCSYDEEWNMQFISDGCYELTGYTMENLINNKDLSFIDLISPEYRDHLRAQWKRSEKKHLPFREEYEITSAEGIRKWVWELGQVIYNTQKEPEALEGIILDISERKKMENNLRYLNDHDRWTGLYNRECLENRLEKDLENNTTSKKALIGINLSTIQMLSVSYGFDYTQSLIKTVAQILSKLCTENCMLYNTYESRFVFYVLDYKDKDELIEFSRLIATKLESLFKLERVGGGIGILEIEQNNGVSVDLILKRLLIASERAINAINTVEKDFSISFYDENLEIIVNRENDIKTELSKIVTEGDSNELYLQYQPIWDLKTDSICGFEALARLNTDILGKVSPIEFIPIAEKTKLIIPIGMKIIYKVFCFIKRLEQLGHNNMRVSINISAIQLFKPDFTETFFDMMEQTNVNPNNICLEITESIFTGDCEHINRELDKLNTAGVHIAIDDFGTGYSSLAREKELNINCLKIDKYFMDRLLEFDPEKTITRDIISMAHRHGHYTIAEGVEREEQKQYLMDYGCDKIQGYLISRPLDEEAAIEFISNQKD